MVQSIDITQNRNEEKKRVQLEEKLAKKYFSGRVDIFNDNYIHIWDESGSEIIATKAIRTVKMQIRKKSLYPLAEKFGRAYEQQFHEGKDIFIIEKDYSKFW